MEWQLLIVIFSALLGLGVGSFINVVIARLPNKQSLGGRSACPHCQYQLQWYDLFPIFSYVALRAHCRNCKEPIAAQYPLVEAGTAALYVALALWLWEDPLRLVIYLVFATLLIILFVYDLKYYLLPDAITLPGIVFGVIGSLILGITWWQILLGILIGGGFFLLQFMISQGRWIGGGDIRLGAMMGAMIGYPNILAALFLAYMLGAIGAVILLMGRKKGMKDMLPFGTFLSSATIVTLFVGNELVQWYVEKILQL